MHIGFLPFSDGSSLPINESMLERLERVRFLQSGGEGELYVYQHPEHPGEEFVVKFSPVPEDKIRLLPSLQRMKEDIDVSRDVQGMVEIYGFLHLITSGSGATLVTFMEFVDAQDLACRDCISEDLGTDVLRQLLKILCRLHAKGYGHCDLKTENVLLTQRGEIFLCDNCGIMRPGRIPKCFGTPGLMPPEVSAACGREEIDTLSVDMFCLGRLAQDIFPNSLPMHLRSLVFSLLDRDPAARPSAEKALLIINIAMGLRGFSRRE